MFPAFYQRNADIVEIQMLTGRDGVNWERLTREQMAPGGEPGTPGEGGYYAGSGLVSYQADEVSMAISATWHTHNEGHYGVTRMIRHAWRALVDRNVAQGRLRVA